MTARSTRSRHADGLRRILSWQWRFHPLAFAAGLAMSFVPAIAGITLLGLSGWFITAAALAGLTGVFLNVMIPSALIRGLALVRTFGRYGERLVTHDATFRFLADLRCRIFSGQAREAGSGRVWRSAGLLGRLTADVAALDGVYLRLAVPTVVAAGVGAVVILACALLSPSLALGPLFALVATATVASGLVRHRKSADGRRLEAAQEALRVRTVDLVAGRRELAVYGGLDARRAAILAADARMGDAEAALQARIVRANVWAGFAAQAAVALTLALALWLVASGDLDLPRAVAAVLLVLGLPEVLAGLIAGYSRIGLMARAADRATARAGSVETAPQEPSTLKAVMSASGEPAGGHDVLTLDGVTFAWPRAARPVLENASLQISAGEWVCIVGPSGSGKSTLASLASGLLGPLSGAVRLGGTDLAALGEAELRRRITVIGQRPALFNDTIAANLRIADQTASDDRLWQALEAAALKDRIARQPEGLETVLGEGGLGLSGGEQRRLGLARAYLTTPDLFILDEMTEGLDAPTAALVLDRFTAFRGKAAVLMIAHKREEMARADRVVSVDALQGRV